MDIQSWACNYSSDSRASSVCSGSKAMRFTLIPHFLMAIIVALSAAIYLRDQERRTQTKSDIDVELTNEDNATKNNEFNGSSPGAKVN